LIERLDYDGSFNDPDPLAERLADSGLSPDACRQKAELFARAANALPTTAGGKRAEGPKGLYVPGRIEVLGKHNDYAGGKSMLVAVQRGFCLVLVPRTDRQITVVDAAWDERAQFELAPDLTPPVGHWSNYPMTVARRVARNFPGAARGADVAFCSDLPSAGGMSSSSAMIVATFLALDAVNRLAASPQYAENIKDLLDLAGYLATVENGQTFGSLEGDRGVGTFGGSEDHTAILNCRPHELTEYGYCPVRFVRSVPMPEGYTFAVGSSGVVAEKTGAAMEKYNTASGLAGALAELWRQATGRDDPHLAAIVAGGPGAIQRLEALVRTTPHERYGTEALLARLEHFVTENEELRPAAGDALARGDMAAFGRFVDRSQKLSETRLGNQVPETIHLAASAREHGAVAACAFGAGFGGSVWAMVETSRTEPFLADWGASYRAHFPQRAEASLFFASGAGPASFRIG